MAELIEGETVYDEIKISHEKSLVVSWTQLVKIPADTYKGMILKKLAREVVNSIIYKFGMKLHEKTLSLPGLSYCGGMCLYIIGADLQSMLISDYFFFSSFFLSLCFFLSVCLSVCLSVSVFPSLSDGLCSKWFTLVFIFVTSWHFSFVSQTSPPMFHLRCHLNTRLSLHFVDGALFWLLKCPDDLCLSYL